MGSLLVLIGATTLRTHRPRHDHEPALQDSLLVSVLRAATGRYADTVPITPERVSFDWVVGPEFFAARVLGPHDIEYVGMAARLPGGTVLPLGCPATRRRLTPFIRLAPDAPPDSILAYAIELAQLDGAIPFEPRVWLGRSSRGFSLVPPGVLRKASLPRVTDGVAYWTVTFSVRSQSPYTVVRVEVLVSKQSGRWGDVVGADPVPE
jgi:hypothetical protein